MDLSQIRLEQAKTLKADARSSAISVSGIIIYVLVLLIAGRHFDFALIWFISTMMMVGATLIFAKFAASEGVTPDNYQDYLFWHTVITFCTGVVWGMNSLLVTDYGSFYSMFVAVTIATSITIGGMFPGNSYRPAYIALAVPTTLTLAAYITVTAPLPIRYFGLGLMLYFAFALLSSAKAELATRDWIITKTQQKFAESVVAHNTEVRQVYDSKSRFLAAASHDLSQPLHAQGHYIEALRQTAHTKEQEDLIEKIALTWRAQKEMLGDLVDVMRLEGGMIEPRFSTFDLPTILAELVNEIRLEADDNDLLISTDMPASLSVSSDPIFLRRIVSNALTNAVKHGGSGKEIEMSVEAEHQNVLIQIKDRGPGFHVDGNVLTAPIEIRRDGVGLTSIENMSALIEATPSLANRADGGGSVFTLRVPRDRPAAAAAEPEKHLRASSVLILDDDRNVLDAVTLLFTQWGVQTLSADTIKRALSVLRSTGEAVDLLIVDNRLADDVDAPKAIAAIRKVTRDDLPAVVVSGDVYAPKKLAGMSGVYILPKPVDARELRRFLSD